jgi:hypothetical protein
MTRRQTALLAFIVAAAVAAAWVAIGRFATERRAVERAAHEERGTAVLPFDPARAVTIRIAGPEGEVRLARAASGWAFTAPVARPADAGDAARFLDALAALHRRATSAPAGLPADLLRPYGLDAPRWRVEVGIEDRGTVSLAVGGTTGAEGIAFVMPTSGDVAIVSTTEREALEAAAEALGARVRLPSAPRPGDRAPARAGPTPARGR